MNVFSRLSTWTQEQSKALVGFVESGLSYARTAAAINDEFKTNYTREAAIGRAWRMGLVSPDKPRYTPRPRKKQPYKPRPKRQPMFIPVETLVLRCAEIVPRNLTLIELEAGDCRWPYGDGPFVHCGLQTFEDSSYCQLHMALSRRNI